ncbi:hypothetical protein SOVF_021980 [Spinacia oleracea]|nr:hypothetical protein SOVF_021980 [Spinacia oleracea]
MSGDTSQDQPLLATADYLESPVINTQIHPPTQSNQIPNVLEVYLQLKELVQAGNLEDARKLFDQMPQRDVVSWTNVEIWLSRGFAFVFQNNGLVNSVFVGSSLLDMYAKFGNISESCRVFDEMPERDGVSWTAIITGLVKAGYCRKGLLYFSEYTFAAVSSGCAHLGRIIWGEQLHGHVMIAGSMDALSVANSVMTFKREVERNSGYILER